MTLRELVARIEARRKVLDAGLTRPQRWRGPLRRELRGDAHAGERERVAAAFDGLADAVAAGRSPPLDRALLLSVHRQIHPRGGDFRSRRVSVGKRAFVAAASDVPDLTARALARACDGVEHPVVAAARLHLELLLVHPFVDANGRTARLLSAYVLMLAGYRSRLLTAVEQHFRHDPSAYGNAFKELAAGERLDHDAALHALLGAMARASECAATVVVPAYAAASTIAACLRGLMAQDLVEPFEVIVVASGTDATADIVRRGFPAVRVFSSELRLAPGTCRNAGIANARGRVVAFLAADCVPEPDWLRRRLDTHDAGHPMVGGFVDAAARSTMAGWGQYFAKFWGLLPLRDVRAVGRGPLFHLSYGADVLRRHGPFREDLIAGEDTLYNEALVASGLRVLYDGAIRVRHCNTRLWSRVRDGQHEQGASAAHAVSEHRLARLFAQYDRPWSTVRLAARALWTVIRARRRLLARFVVTLPWTMAALAARRRGFRSSAEPPELGSSADARELAPGGGPPISVVVAAYNEERTIGRCLDALLRQTVEPLEIVVVDDGSTDRTGEIAESRGARVVRVPHRGPARARNAGALVATGEVIAFVDADMECEPKSIERLVAPILDGSEIGTFTTELSVANGVRRWAACWTLNRGFPPGCVFPPGFPDRWSNYRAVDREAFLSVGGYDDVGYGEDMTLAPKLGRDAAAVPGATMLHHNPDTLREVWGNARWVGRGARIRELERPWRFYLPWRSVRRGVAVARASRRPSFVLFKLVYDTGVLSGYVASFVRPARHWK